MRIVYAGYVKIVKARIGKSLQEAIRKHKQLKVSGNVQLLLTCELTSSHCQTICCFQEAGDKYQEPEPYFPAMYSIVRQKYSITISLLPTREGRSYVARLPPMVH